MALANRLTPYKKIAPCEMYLPVKYEHAAYDTFQIRAFFETSKRFGTFFCSQGLKYGSGDQTHPMQKDSPSRFSPPETRKPNLTLANLAFRERAKNGKKKKINKIKQKIKIKISTFLAPWGSIW